MESSKHSMLCCLVPLLLLAAVPKVKAGDELTTFIIHVHPHENDVLATADERKAWYESFLPEEGRLVHACHHVASGFAAQLTPDELDEMSTMPGFVNAVADQTYELQTTHTPQFLGLDALQAGNISDGGGERGAGIIIGVIDTGVFPFHPSFSDAGGMPPPPAKWTGRCEFNDGSAARNNKLIGARSFVSTSNGTIISPLDDSGHGNHAASTAAGAAVPGANVLGQGTGVATGMGPRAHVAAYKVCHELFCRGSDVLAAVADGCDVISVSLAGLQNPFHKDPVAVGTFGAIRKGVFVSVVAGNFGPSERSLRNEAPWALTVAASTMDRSIRATVRLGNGLSFHGESAYQPDDDASPSATFYPLVYAGLCGTGSLDGMDVKGKIVLCEYWSGPGGSNLTRVMKGAVVKNAGGAGMVVLNNLTLGYSTLAEPHVLPASHIDYAASVAVTSYLNNSTANPMVRIVFGGTVLGTSPAPSMAFFFSRGPSVQDPGVLKPDITGPGVNVLAAWLFKVGPTDQTSGVSGGPTFNFLPGTSVSTAHLSGIAAIIKSKHPDWSPAAIKSAIMTTADVIDRSGNPILDEKHQPADWFATGAGHVNPGRAIDPGLVYDIEPSNYVGYLCGLYTTSEEVSMIARWATNCSDAAVIPDIMLNYPSISVVFPQTWNWNLPMVVQRTVKNVGKVPSTYTPKVDVPAGDVTIDVSPSELVFTEMNQELSFKVTVRPGQNGTKVVQGALRWVSGTYTVRSPVSISFA